MADILVDSDVFIDHLRGQRRFVPGVDSVYYSVVTRCELFAGCATGELNVDMLLGPFHELPVDREIAQRAGRLRRASDLRMPDALIAATALEHGLMLVTRNRRYFESVAGLRMRDPSDVA